MELLKAPTVAALNDQQISLPLFKHGDQKERKTEDFVLLGMKSLNNFSFINKEEKPEAEDSSESSSIGVQSPSSSSSEDDEERGNEVQSKLNEDKTLPSLDSLEDSLPIKRGLSNFFAGKSKSFATLSEASAGSAKDLKKQENPFNKRRRILMAKKISRTRRASYSSLFSPDHTVNEREENENEIEIEEQFPSFSPLPKFLNHVNLGGLNKPFKSPRSFSLSDLQHV